MSPQGGRKETQHPALPSESEPGPHVSWINLGNSKESALSIKGFTEGSYRAPEMCLIWAQHEEAELETRVQGGGHVASPTRTQGPDGLTEWPAGSSCSRGPAPPSSRE